MKTKLLSIVLLISMAFIACKKEGPTTTSKSTLEKISGKWKLLSSVQNSFYSGTSHITTYNGTAADYADFRNDYKVYSFVNNAYDTSAFGLISETKMYIDTYSESFEIQKLTDGELKLYRKEIFSSGDYDESTINFAR